MAYAEIDVASLSGLPETEVQRLLKTEGYNELPLANKKHFFSLLWEIFQEPMFLLLAACGGIYLTLGDIHEALMLLGFVGIIIGITLYQKRKTERALEALRDLSSPRALVIRDGHQKRIAGREVVRGDILLLSEGDRVPADAVLLSCINMSVDESLLTGESAAVRKSACENDVVAAHRPGGDDLPTVYSGTMIIKGTGIARVIATGGATEIGKIGKALHAIEASPTLLEKEIHILVKNLAIVGLACCTLVVVIYGLTRNNWLNGLLAGITLAMATLPEEFPVVLTVFLALGAWRMSRHNVLTRKVSVIETLGSATVLCVDKTGTLTTNRMILDTLYTNKAEFTIDHSTITALPDRFHELIEFGILASQRDPFDPMEQALKDLGAKTLSGTDHLHGNWTLVQEYPLDKKLLAMSRVWQSPGGNDYIIAAKGAPEAIIDLCHLDAPAAATCFAQVAAMAHKGLRVLGVAQAQFTAGHLPGGQHDFSFSFLGFIGLIDPLRETVPAAIAECRRAGIRVIMITGDYPETAKNIGRKIGLANADDCITGAELTQMTDDELRRRIQSVSICARVLPEQKLRIVNVLKANGEIVAMTGDGVNDSPALKSAQIGIAMGSRGTDVAREAADIVLVNDDFSSIVAGVGMGRRIFDNLRKAMAYIFAVHVPITGMSLIPVILKWPLVLMPVHVLFLELIIDPACSIVFEVEPAENGIMNRKPRNLANPLFGKHMVFYSVLQGIGLLAIIATIFFISKRTAGEDEARALTFTTMIFANVGLILINRSGTQNIFKTLAARNNAFWWVLGGSTFFLGLVLTIAPLRGIFKFAPISFGGLTLCIAGGLLSMIWAELLKRIYRKWINS
ncbi:MAG: cation-translocating P-type ATPase [Elusimicrobia bacterium]|nr:cation-translocating P-type ATPase [Elusimicrobiota bacterium]